MSIIMTVVTSPSNGLPIGRWGTGGGGGWEKYLPCGSTCQYLGDHRCASCTSHIVRSGTSQYLGYLVLRKIRDQGWRRHGIGDNRLLNSDHDDKTEGEGGLLMVMT